MYPRPIGRGFTRGFANLIGNAIKFTEKGSITLDMQARTAHADHVLVELMVIDTGVGMPEDTQRIIFDKFSQADDSTTRQYGGSGLGLAISHQLAELMGGELTVDSELNKGSTFTLKLKLQIPETTAPYHDLSLDNTVLFHRVNQQKLWPLIEEHARSWGIQTYPLPDPQTDESIDCLMDHLTPSIEASSNQIILLDTTQPLSDTLIQALVQWLKTHSPQLNHCGVILMMPATHIPEGIEPLIGAGAVPIVKPPTPSRLYDAIANIALHTEARPPLTSESDQPQIGQIEGQPLSILVIDDVDINLEVAHNLLSRVGLKCDTECSPKAALSRLEKQRYDAILIDLHMAELSGFELAKTLKAQSGPNQNTLLIALTASVTDQDQARAQAAGMDAYLTKPLMPDEIKALLTQHLAVTFKPTVSTDTPPEARPTSDEVSGLIDFEQLNQQVDQDTHLVDAYLKQGYSTLEDIMVTMEDAYEDHDKDKMALLAHRLKGISGNIAALSLHTAAQSFEHSLASGQSSDEWPSLRTLLAQHIKALKPYAALSDTESTDTLSPQSLLQQLQQLDEQLAHHRAIDQDSLSPIRQALKTIADQDNTATEAPALTQDETVQLIRLSDELEHAIQRFNYSLARSSIHAILKILNA